MRRVYLGTVCLERNRWGSRQPSFRASEWIPRFMADGFDGVELWENHFLAADPEEQERLAASPLPVAVYSTYAAFEATHAATREAAAAAVVRLRAGAVKYNLGSDPSRTDEYRRSLLAWAAGLPPFCRLLCECHPGTVLDRPETAAAFLADLDPERFGGIAHMSGDPRPFESWFTILGARVMHVHVQFREPALDPATPAGREKWRACFSVLRAYAFAGDLTIEFTRGIGKGEDIETLYANARRDLAYCKEELGKD